MSNKQPFQIGDKGMTMIERVARALAVQHQNPHDDAWHAYSGMARAAIAAMREPPSTISDEVERLTGIRPRNAMDAFNAVIDAALAEPHQ